MKRPWFAIIWFLENLIFGGIFLVVDVIAVLQIAKRIYGNTLAKI